MPKFAKGQPKPSRSGRRAGTPNRVATWGRQISEPDDKEIVDQVLAAAKVGDRTAWQIYFRYLRRPPPRLNTTPITVIRPETIEDVRGATGELLIKMLAGELDLGTVDVASTLLKTVEASIVGYDLADQHQAMKAQLQIKGKPS